MVTPVPGYPISTPYGSAVAATGPATRTSTETESTQGLTTRHQLGRRWWLPVAAGLSTAATAAAFGYHQLEILPGDGTRDFYAHMPSRAVADGSQVTAGQTIGKVGSEGNATGPHLHFERHSVATGGWSCSRGA